MTRVSVLACERLRADLCVRVFAWIKKTLQGVVSVADLLYGESEWTNAQVGLCVRLCVCTNKCESI